ncbi:MAG: DUF1376 domain-containing protein [Burkholderiaceae bacterium]|nr:DUF1376 domain-containing protein [Burkholderiaceae bacterium]
MIDLKTLPIPLTPSDCDLTDFQFMPLEVRRLRDSDLAALESPEACWAAVLLWCASWHQVPAASLPDDDRVLSNLAGYGRVVKEWQRIKDGALRGWVKCSDGRLYHPTVAEKANESWKSKVKYAYDKLVDRTKKANGKREKDRQPLVGILTIEEWISAGRPEHFPMPSQGTPTESPKNSPGKADNSDGKLSDSAGKDNQDEGIPPENALKGQGQGQGQGEGYIKDKAAAANISTTVAPVDNSPPSPVSDENPENLLPDGPARFAVLIRRWERDRGKASKTTSSDPRLMIWTGKGVTDEQLQEAYDLAVADRDLSKDPTPINAGFLDTMLAKVLAPPAAGSALSRTPLPASVKPWQASSTGIQSKAVELGIVQGADELFPHFRDRVYASADMTEEEKSRLRADWGVLA